VAFIRLSQFGEVLEDMFDQVQFEEQKDCDYNLIKLPNLKAGQYTLRLVQQAKEITINVHRGKYWETDSFILKRTCLFENRQVQKPVKFKKVEFKQGQVEVELKDFSKDTRVHMLAFQFVPEDLDQFYRTLKNIT